MWHLRIAKMKNPFFFLIYSGFRKYTRTHTPTTTATYSNWKVVECLYTYYMQDFICSLWDLYTHRWVNLLIYVQSIQFETGELSINFSVSHTLIYLFVRTRHNLNTDCLILIFCFFTVIKWEKSFFIVEVHAAH